MSQSNQSSDICNSVNTVRFVTATGSTKEFIYNETIGTYDEHVAQCKKLSEDEEIPLQLANFNDKREMALGAALLGAQSNQPVTCDKPTIDNYEQNSSTFAWVGGELIQVANDCPQEWVWVDLNETDTVGPKTKLNKIPDNLWFNVGPRVNNPGSNNPNNYFKYNLLQGEDGVTLEMPGAFSDKPQINLYPGIYQKCGVFSGTDSVFINPDYMNQMQHAEVAKQYGMELFCFGSDGSKEGILEAQRKLFCDVIPAIDKFSKTLPEGVDLPESWWIGGVRNKTPPENPKDPQPTPTGTGMVNWRWLNKQPWNFEIWNSQEPDNNFCGSIPVCNENRVALNGFSELEDLLQWYKYPAIYERTVNDCDTASTLSGETELCGDDRPRNKLCPIPTDDN